MKKTVQPTAIIFLTFLCLGTFLEGCREHLSEPWLELFNGKDLLGWKITDGSAEVSVEEGVIVARQTDTMNFPYLVTEKEFGDFILELEARLTGPLNSGVLIRGISDPEKNKGKVHGFQMEIDQSERKWTGGIYEEAGRLWLTPLEGMEEAMAAYRVSDWNRYRIEAIRDTFKIWVNGVPTTHLVDSKTGQGILGFQIHKRPSHMEIGTLRIKNIRIITENPEGYSLPISLPAVYADQF
jgi:hypothetical protein